MRAAGRAMGETRGPSEPSGLTLVCPRTGLAVAGRTPRRLPPRRHLLSKSSRDAGWRRPGLRCRASDRTPARRRTAPSESGGRPDRSDRADRSPEPTRRPSRVAGARPDRTPSCLSVPCLPAAGGTEGRRPVRLQVCSTGAGAPRIAVSRAHSL